MGDEWNGEAEDTLGGDWRMGKIIELCNIWVRKLMKEGVIRKVCCDEEQW